MCVDVEHKFEVIQAIISDTEAMVEFGDETTTCIIRAHWRRVLGTSHPVR
jgi:hypothetical protein